jgi:RNA polymerase sigma factor (sigma-70 family)
MDHPSDGELVGLSLRGERQAYGRLVERYQNLVCALAYSACGSFSRSEDIAQDAFVAAWRQLASLQDRSRFKAWLCGIVRNLAHSQVRRQQRDAVAVAEPLDGLPEPAAAVPSPREQAISREEEALVWGALAELPETYRGPLVLFYRENQSAAEVAQSLDLSVEAARQRLSRGREMLKAQVAARVEGALRKTRPGKAFTVAVVVALPALAPSAAAATLATAAKGGTAMKSAAALAWAGAILGPVIGILGGWLGARASIESTRTPRERAFMVRMSWLAAGYAVLFTLALLAVILLGVRLAGRSPGLFAGLIIGVVVLYTAGLFAFVLWGNARQRQIQREDAVRLGVALPTDNAPAPPPGGQAARCEYRSKTSLLGLPLVHVVTGGGVPGQPHRRRVAVGWIAIGDIAFGVLFAAGGIACGGIAMGGLSLGVISLGGAALGGLAFGGLGIGIWAAGGAALGVFAFGGVAVAWHAALGGLAVAREIAMGGAAVGAHANDALARNYVQNNVFFSAAQASMTYLQWLWLLAFLPLGAMWRARRQPKVSGPAR